MAKIAPENIDFLPLEDLILKSSPMGDEEVQISETEKIRIRDIRPDGMAYDDEKLDKVSQSFVKLRDGATDDQIKWTAALQNVRIILSEELPTIDKRIYSSLIRRGHGQSPEGKNEIRLKYRRDNGTFANLAIFYPPREDENQNGGLTHVDETATTTLGPTARLIVDVDWNVFPVPFGQWLDGGLANEPFYAVKQELVQLQDWTTTSVAAIEADVKADVEAEYQRNLGSSFISFVPQIDSRYFGNIPTGNIVITTPYKLEDSFTYNIEFIFRTAGLDRQGNKGTVKSTLDFWGRNNGTFDYYTPKLRYNIDSVTLPGRVALNAGGYICIIFGADGVALSDYLTTNLGMGIEKVVVNALSTTLVPDARKFGWAIRRYDPLPDTYTNITAAEIVHDTPSPASSGSEMIPVKHKSFALFGSSKTASRTPAGSWLSYLLRGAMGLAGYTDTFKSNVTPDDRIESSKAFSSISGKKITGVGSYFEFTLFGKSATIAQLLERTENYAEFDIYVDGEKIGSSNNRNMSMRGTKTQTFSGTGSQRSFFIDDLDSYNFSVTVGGVAQNVSMRGSLPAGYDCYAVRTIMPDTYPGSDGKPRRILYFPAAPASGVEINVTYSTGRVIGYALSDYNEVDNGTEELPGPVYIADLESTATYQSGYPLSPLCTDPAGLIRLNFDSYAARTIRLVITGGVNPYLSLDFAVSEYSPWMDSAFRGYDFQRAISEPRWRDWRCLRYLPSPDIILLEYGTNDDRFEIDRVAVSEHQMTYEELSKVRMKDVVYINYDSGNYTVGLCTGTIGAITPFSITSPQIIASDIEAGDYVKIGRYYSSWKEFAVRRITAVDKTSGTLTWEMPLSVEDMWHYKDLTDLVGEEFAVRRLGAVKDYYRTLIGRMQGVSPSSEIALVGMSAYNNNDYCSGWGYNEAQQDISKENGVRFINISDEQQRYNEGGLADPVVIPLTSTGAADYQVGAALVPNSNREMRVFVNGKDVTGKSAYVERTDGWYLTEGVAPEAVTLNKGQAWSRIVTFATDYASNPPVKPLAIHFYGDVPSTSDTIELHIGGYGWSDDGVHQVDQGNQTYASCIIEVLT